MTSVGADIGPGATGASDTVTAPPTLRPLHADDAAAVLSAFRSDPAMSRQGTVTTSEEAKEYVHRLTDPDGSKIAWAVCHGDGLVGLVCIAVDEQNRNGWFSYWMTEAVRGRGWTWTPTDGCERIPGGRAARRRPGCGPATVGATARPRRDPRSRGVSGRTPRGSRS